VADASYGVRLAGPQLSRVVTAVVSYSFVLFLLVEIVVDILFALPLLRLHTLAICIVCAGIGIALAFIEDYDFDETVRIGLIGRPPPPPWWCIYLRALLMAVIVTIFIVVIFLYTRPYHGQQGLVLAAGFASALAWALSVAGSLIWRHLGILSHVYWNSWFNLFAAGFAAMTAALT
jgi:hypothetical protein